MARLLLVDDSTLIREIVAESLRDAGHTVVEAGNGQDGLSAARQGAPASLIITDLNMPVLDGLAMVRALRESPGYRDVPVVVHSSERPNARRIEAELVKVTAWVVKPFRLSALVELIDELLVRARNA